MNTQQVLAKYWEMKDAGHIRDAETMLLAYVKYLDDENIALKATHDVDEEEWRYNFPEFKEGGETDECSEEVLREVGLHGGDGHPGTLRQEDVG